MSYFRTLKGLDYDICPFIEAHSGLFTTVAWFDDLPHGIRAEFIEVLISRKLATQVRT